MTEFGPLDEGLHQPSPDSSTPQSLGPRPVGRLSLAAWPTAHAAAPLPRLPAQPRSSRAGCGCCARAGGCAACVALLGPAFVAAVAYVDPGNFATNFSAGAAVRLRARLGDRGWPT